MFISVQIQNENQRGEKKKKNTVRTVFLKEKQIIYLAKTG